MFFPFEMQLKMARKKSAGKRNFGKTFRVESSTRTKEPVPLQSINLLVIKMYNPEDVQLAKSMISTESVTSNEDQHVEENPNVEKTPNVIENQNVEENPTVEEDRNVGKIQILKKIQMWKKI